MAYESTASTELKSKLPTPVTPQSEADRIKQDLDEILRILNAGVATLAVTEYPDGKTLHIVDTGVYGTFRTNHWYNMDSGAVIK